MSKRIDIDSPRYDQSTFEVSIIITITIIIIMISLLFIIIYQYRVEQNISLLQQIH